MKNFLLRITFLVSFLSTFAGAVNAQDVHFSQFFEAPLWRNPALAGIFEGDIRVQAVYRNQYPGFGVPNTYETGSLNAEYKMPVGSGNDFITVGGQFMYDKAGSINFSTTHILPAVNYHKSLSSDRNTYLSLGFMGGLVSRSIDRSKMTTNNHFDGNGYNPSLGDGETFPSSGYNYLDGSVGLSFNTYLGANPNNNMYAGVAYHHFNRPLNSFYKNPDVELNAKWVYSLGMRFHVSDYSYFTVQADHSRQGAYEETIGGAMYSMKLGESPDEPDYILHFGGYLRWSDAFIPVVKIDYNPFSIALSYDVNVSQLRTASQGRGGLELSLTYVGFFDRGNTTKNAVLCPRF
jgi:type IX secretion system PorP/SprF family membrane protein